MIAKENNYFFLAVLKNCEKKISFHFFLYTYSFLLLPES